MSLFQFILVIASVLFLLFALDAYQRRKLTFIHFIVFIGWSFFIGLFSVNVDLLNKFGNFFGIARGADLIVYISIILFWWFYFDLLNKQTKWVNKFTKFISFNAIEKAWKYKSKIKNKTIEDNFLFLIRVYNEELTIWKVIDEIYQKGFHKILVVNDGSTDNSLEILKNKQNKYKKNDLFVLNHTINRGWWAANKTWFEFIRRNQKELNVDWVVTYDADCQMTIDDMEVFIKTIQTNSETKVFLGSRFIKWATSENMPFIRKLLLVGSRMVTFIFDGLLVTDPHNGFRILHINLFQDIKLYSDGMTYASELLSEIKKLWVSIKEVPVNIVYTDYSLGKWQKNSNAFKILVEIIYKKFFFK